MDLHEATNDVLVRLDKLEMIEEKANNGYPLLEDLVKSHKNNLLNIAMIHNSQRTFDFLLNYYCKNFLEGEIIPDSSADIEIEIEGLLYNAVDLAKLTNSDYFVYRIVERTIEYIKDYEYSFYFQVINRIKYSLERTINRKEKLNDIKNTIIKKILSIPKLNLEEYLKRENPGIGNKSILVLIRNEAMNRGIDKKIILEFFINIGFSKWMDIYLPILDKKDFELKITINNFKKPYGQISIEQGIILGYCNRFRFIVKNPMNDEKIDDYLKLFEIYKTNELFLKRNSVLGWILKDCPYLPVKISYTKFEKIVKFLTTKTNKKVVTYLKNHINSLETTKIDKTKLLEILEKLS